LKKIIELRDAVINFPTMWYAQTGGVVMASFNIENFQNSYYYPEINLWPRIGGWNAIGL
jgi:hypothetical protein